MIRDVKFAALVDKKPRLFNLQVRALVVIAIAVLSANLAPLQFKNEAKVYTYKAQSEAEASTYHHPQQSVTIMHLTTSFPPNRGDGEQDPVEHEQGGLQRQLKRRKKWKSCVKENTQRKQ